MPNNGVISRQAVIPSEFLVSSTESTDLVIINTPTTGNKVQQKAVPVSSLSPYYSYVVNLKSDGSEDVHEVLYNDLPETIIFDVQYIPGLTSSFRIYNDENAENQINFRGVVFFTSPLNITTLGVTVNSSHITFSDFNDDIFSTGFFYAELRIYKNTL